ncbi:hypothetical protein LMG28727_07583 [Paraburkholderia kirstenboschensis]|nr:hypothetical protein [Paraburkholderia kirstenboschensis]CAD6561902.1 hypothetical protein LMG28727_07583 [Paraburkholderia kirstenboschensis]
MIINYEASTSSARALAGDNFPSFYGNAMASVHADQERIGAMREY